MESPGRRSGLGILLWRAAGIVLANAWGWHEYPVCRPGPYDIADKNSQWLEPYRDPYGDFTKQPYPKIRKPYCFRWYHGPVTGSLGKGRDWMFLFDYCHEGDANPPCDHCDDIDCVGRANNHGFKFYSEDTESKKAHPLRGEYFAPCGSYWMFDSTCCGDCEQCSDSGCCSDMFTEGKGFWTIQGAVDQVLKGHIRHSPNGTMEGHSATPEESQHENVGHRWKVFSPDDSASDTYGPIAAEMINLEKKAYIRIYKDGAIRIRSSTDITGQTGKAEVFLGNDGHCWLKNLTDDTYIEFPGGPAVVHNDLHVLGNMEIDGFCLHDGCTCDSVFVFADGKEGGQQVCGGTGPGESLTLKGSADPEAGPVVVDSNMQCNGAMCGGPDTNGDLVVDSNLKCSGTLCGSSSANGKLTIRGTTDQSKGQVSVDSDLECTGTLCGGSDANGDLTIRGTSDSSKGNVTIDAGLECNGSLGSNLKTSIIDTVPYRSLQATIDSGDPTNPIESGDWIDIYVDYDCTIVQCTLLAKPIMGQSSGSAVLDIWRDTYANFEPTDEDSITGSSPPTISSDKKAQDSTLSGWSKTLSSGNVLRINVDSCSNLRRIAISLKVKVR